ncbi:hypothetical protein EDC56_1986 [Sinobacterium caligoides]|uniref:Aminoglycoside phosphotransferase domain-containing protein n=1 Tax=Sinobacterium caligoides TaxID=933926 RepID=A0A3N2DP02_9GAMM|nr:phosphotransferase [Sinobacterium caligoides]ROS01544.1 hypothetical protein EDC56_1986 [Sinobacterium caligoides]
MSVAKLLNWTLAQLNIGANDDYCWAAVSGDASFRHYYRLESNGRSYIVVSAPPEKEKNHEFVAIADGLRASGVLTPEIIAVDYQQGFILQQDLGDQLLLPLLNEGNVDGWYAQAMDSMLRLSQSALSDLPVYGVSLLSNEFALFAEWFVSRELDYTLSAKESALLASLNDILVASAQQQPQVVVHRDYHARNIMIVGKQLGVIDFQDAVLGPVSYDLVSLLKDCYVRWPREQVVAWVEQYRLSYQALTGQSFDTGQWLRWFDLMGLQRHIKVLGIFCRLWLRDGKEAYLVDLPRVIAYVEEVAGLYPELESFSKWFSETILPLAEQQPWFQRS